MKKRILQCISLSGLHRPILTSLLCVLTFVGGNNVLAVPPTTSPDISFIYTGHARGTLGGVPLYDAAFIIRATANTHDVQPIGLGVAGMFIDHLNVLISIDGFGQGHFQIPTRTWVNNSLSSVGLGRAGFGGLDLFAIPAPDPVGSWDLSSDLGPFSAPVLYINPPQFIDVPTSLGLLTISENATNGSFTAALIPEPMSAIVCIEVAIFGLLGRGSRRTASSTS